MLRLDLGFFVLVFNLMQRMILVLTVTQMRWMLITILKVFNLMQQLLYVVSSDSDSISKSLIHSLPEIPSCYHKLDHHTIFTNNTVYAFFRLIQVFYSNS